MTTFDASAARQRLDKFWSLGAQFGLERDAREVYLQELVSDRYALINGLQVLRDELQFVGPDEITDIRVCGVDFGLPSVCTTLAQTNCGDRIHQGEDSSLYDSIVAARFATLSERGGLKTEAFYPPGGGTDHGPTLAHVTVAHQLDGTLRQRLYDGNPQSYVLVAMDLKTHCGRLDEEEKVTLGRTRESRWREPRDACGALMGALRNYSAENPVHRRLREDLGEENFSWLSSEVDEPGPLNIVPLVAACVVAVRGMEKTLDALWGEEHFRPRGLAHLTASVTINRPDNADTLIYLSRATLFQGERRVQGFGTDAQRYKGTLLDMGGRNSRLLLTYDGVAAGSFVTRTADCQAALAGGAYFE